MQLFDCHFHITKGDDGYGLLPEGRNIIFNYIDEYQSKKHEAGISDSVSLIFDFREEFDFIKAEVKSQKLAALKVHSRIQQLQYGDYNALFEGYEKLESPDIPVIFDAFYFGSDLQFQPSLPRITEFARLFKETKVIVAHSGGIKVLEYFLHLKDLPNIYFDLSFSLVYLSKASVFQDYKNLLQFASSDKLLFGTDFPFVSGSAQLDRFLEIAKELKLEDEKVDKILFQNSYNLFAESKN